MKIYKVFYKNLDIEIKAHTRSEARTIFLERFKNIFNGENILIIEKKKLYS